MLTLPSIDKRTGSGYLMSLLTYNFTLKAGTVKIITYTTLLLYNDFPPQFSKHFTKEMNIIIPILQTEKLRHGAMKGPRSPSGRIRTRMQFSGMTACEAIH